jgi:hypothetical protein
MATATRTEGRLFSYVDWPAIFAGAVAAAALAFVLHSFAIAVGLSVSSTAPTWRDGSAFLWIISGLYLLLAAIASYGFGGYLAGAMRSTGDLTAEQTEVRDGAHGLFVWALATLLTVAMLFAGAGMATRLAAPGSQTPSVSVGGENIIAYDIDRLFRAEKLAEVGPERRAEAARILLTVGGHEGMSAEDRTHLVRIVSATTGLAPEEASKRVDRSRRRCAREYPRCAAELGDDGLHRGRVGVAGCGGGVVRGRSWRPSPGLPQYAEHAVGLDGPAHRKTPREIKPKRVTNAASPGGTPPGGAVCGRVSWPCSRPRSPAR